MPKMVRNPYMARTMLRRAQRVKPDPRARLPQRVTANCHRPATRVQKTPAALWNRRGCHADALLVRANHDTEPAALRVVRFTFTAHVRARFASCRLAVTSLN